MKTLRLFLAAAFLGLAVGACTSPTVEYPQPDPEPDEEEPGKGLVVTQPDLPTIFW